MKLGRALTSGLGGAVAAVLIFLVAHVAVGRDADMSVIVGEWITSQGNSFAWLAGAIAQLVLGTVLGLAYAAAFEFVFRHSGVLPRLAIATPHVIIAGFAVGWFTAPPQVAAPLLVGAFLSFVGPGAVAAFVIAHAVFGLVVGALYGRTLHSPSEAPVVWREINDAMPEDAP